MIRDNLVLKDVDCVAVSKIYHVFEFVQTMEAKIIHQFELAHELEALKESHKHEKAKIIHELRQTEVELEEAKKPKRKPRAKKKS